MYSMSRRVLYAANRVNRVNRQAGRPCDSCHSSLPLNTNYIHHYNHYMPQMALLSKRFVARQGYCEDHEACSYVTYVFYIIIIVLHLVYLSDVYILVSSCLTSIYTQTSFYNKVYIFIIHIIHIMLHI